MLDATFLEGNKIGSGTSYPIKNIQSIHIFHTQTSAFLDKLSEYIYGFLLYSSIITEDTNRVKQGFVGRKQYPDQ